MGESGPLHSHRSDRITSVVVLAVLDSRNLPVSVAKVNAIYCL